MDAVINQFKPRILQPTAAVTPKFQWTQRGPAAITPDDLVRGCDRVVLIAPHPDDEVLAMGGSLASLAESGHEILIVAVTDGEGSHPGSQRWTPEALRAARPRESHEALLRLGIDAEIVRLGLPDGGLASHEKDLAGMLPICSGDAVLVPWRHDGHADHEACARAALAMCRTVGARCIEFPVWALVPTHPAHARLRKDRLQKVALSARWNSAKCRAIEAFGSQVARDGDTPPVLHSGALAAWTGASEWVIA